MGTAATDARCLPAAQGPMGCVWGGGTQSAFSQSRHCQAALRGPSVAASCLSCPICAPHALWGALRHSLGRSLAEPKGLASSQGHRGSRQSLHPTHLPRPPQVRGSGGSKEKGSPSSRIRETRAHGLTVSGGEDKSLAPESQTKTSPWLQANCWCQKEHHVSSCHFGVNHPVLSTPSGACPQGLHPVSSPLQAGCRTQPCPRARPQELMPDALVPGRAELVPVRVEEPQDGWQRNPTSLPRGSRLGSVNFCMSRASRPGSPAA